MEKFRLVCKKCESQNIRFYLKTIDDVKLGDKWAVMQIKCTECDNYVEIEETNDVDTVKYFETAIGWKHEICS